MQTLFQTLHDRHWAAKCWPENLERRSCNRRPRESKGIKFEQQYVSGPFGSGIFFFFTDYFLAIICVHILHKGLSCHGHFHIDQPTGFLDSRLGEFFLAASMVKAWRRQGEIYRNIIKTFIFLRQQKTVVNFNLHHLRARNLRCLRMPCSNISSLHHYVRCRLHDQEPSGHRCLLLLFCLLPIHRRPSLHAFLPPTQEQRRTHHSHALKLKLK